MIRAKKSSLLVGVLAIWVSVILSSAILAKGQTLAMTQNVRQNASQNETAEELSALATASFEAGDFVRAEILWRSAIQKGDKDANLQLAWFLFLRNLMPKWLAVDISADEDADEWFDSSGIWRDFDEKDEAAEEAAFWEGVYFQDFQENSYAEIRNLFLDAESAEGEYAIFLAGCHCWELDEWYEDYLEFAVELGHPRARMLQYYVELSLTLEIESENWCDAIPWENEAQFENSDFENLIQSFDLAPEVLALAEAFYEEDEEDGESEARNRIYRQLLTLAEGGDTSAMCVLGFFNEQCYNFEDEDGFVDEFEEEVGENNDDFIIPHVEISRSVRRWSLRTTARKTSRKTGILNDDEYNEEWSVARWYWRAAKAGNDDALLAIFDLGFPDALDVAVRRNNKSACFLKGMQLLEYDKFAEAAVLFKKAQEREPTKVDFMLGLCYYALAKKHPERESAFLKAAVRRFVRAIEAGDNAAAGYLANIFFYRDGFRDLKKTLVFYEIYILSSEYSHLSEVDRIVEELLKSVDR
ncbi:MAG: hypothetical protein Q4D38_14500 [Planctomycetia bacterium]|nr:hypothetical protein [Planctomycetia bacterium]